eukprot:CCRYP_013867-RB/>CCRYP_013867-RB protein AED:0.16 eAED:0.16 QI:0/0.33/0.5/1/0/0/4/2504/242
MDHMHIDPCHTATTVGATATDSYVTAEHSSRDYTRLHGGVNNTYAEKELLRRLKNGWVSTGIDCNECGMPIICQKEGGEGLMECIICGVMEFNEEGAAHSTPLGENVGVDDETISCFDTTITSGFTIASHAGLIQITVDPVKRFYRPTIPPSQLIMRHIVRPTKNMIMKCKSDLASQDDDALKKELGRRIFSGWTLLSLSCPSCNLPLISEGKDGPCVCLSILCSRVDELTHILSNMLLDDV